MSRFTEQDLSARQQRKLRTIEKSACKKAQRFARRKGRRPTPDEVRAMRVQTMHGGLRCALGVASASFLTIGGVFVYYGPVVFGVITLLVGIMFGVAAITGSMRPLETTIEGFGDQGVHAILDAVFDSLI